MVRIKRDIVLKNRLRYIEIGIIYKNKGLCPYPFR